MKIKSIPLPVFPSNPVAFFCMEYAIDKDYHNYAGGLGILAGDYVFEAAEQEMPLVAVGLHYGDIVPEEFNLLQNSDGTVLIIEVPVADRMVKVKVWHHLFGKKTHLLFLDTATDGNTPEDVAITSKLYDSSLTVRIRQQLVLGVGGVKLLKLLGIKPAIYHLNEGHTSFASLALMGEYKEGHASIAATKHTIFPDAGICISKGDFDGFVAPYCRQAGLDPEKIFTAGQHEKRTHDFSTTKFLMHTCDISNGVSILHTVYEKKEHPQSKLIPITNGVHVKRWRAVEWGGSPLVLGPEEFWKIKSGLRGQMISFAEKISGEKLDRNACTVVWSRRFAAYKRPFLLFSDLSRLKKIVSNPDRPVQFIISGKAHPNDPLGQETIKKIVDISKTPDFKGKIVYLPDYSIDIARFLVKGADVWLNTPELGKEACGTSGIKACLNGALQCSVSDGWVDEVDWKGAGWILSEHNTADDMYQYLSDEIPALFHEKDASGLPSKWIERMFMTIGIAQAQFTAARMLKDYAETVYHLS